MEMNEYQSRCMKYRKYKEHLDILYPCLGLAGEVGEALNKIKKVYRDKEGKFSMTDLKEIEKELGDIFWYLAILSKDFGFKLDDVALNNLIKLEKRFNTNTLAGSGDKR